MWMKRSLMVNCDLIRVEVVEIWKLWMFTWVDGWVKWRLNSQDAISPGRKTWPGRLRHNGQHLQHRLASELQPPPLTGDGTGLRRRPGFTRSLEDARYIHINFRLLAELVVFEQVKTIKLLFYLSNKLLCPFHLQVLTGILTCKWCG